jgi:hypothetical protein
MLRRVLFICGFVAPLVYIAAVILGGALQPGYSHLSMSVSGLIGAGSPNLLLLSILFIVYNVFIIVFAWAEGMGIRGEDLHIMTAGCVTLGVAGLLGILVTVLIPMLPLGQLTTIQSIGRFALLGALALSAVLTVPLLGLGSKIRDAFWIYSLVTAFLLIVSAGFTVALTILGHPLVGLAERIAMGLFLLWVLVNSAGLIAEDLGRSRR